MRKLIILFAVLGCIGWACRGGIGSAVPNPYRGNWFGPWSSPTRGEDGTLTILIEADGVITGTLSITLLGTDNAFSGSVGIDGRFSGTVDNGTSGIYNFDGTMAIDGQNHLIGAFELTINDVEYGGSFDLIPGSGGGGDE